MTAQGSVYSWCGCRDQRTGRRLGSKCPRRGQPGHGSWYVSLELPAGPGGNRRRIRRGGFPDRAAAEAALERLVMPAQAGQADHLMPVGQWLRYWLDSRAAPRLSTLRGYASHIRLYLDPCLGQIQLADPRTAHVQAMFTAITRQRAAEGRPVTAATLARIKATLRAALNAAIRAGYLVDNPACRAELPSAGRPRPVVWTTARVREWERTGIRPPVAVWMPAHTAQFLNSIQGDRLYAAYHLIALRGLRGEAAGLRWYDVDLDGATAIISQQLQQYSGHLTVCPPKTARSERAVALDRATVTVLRRHRAAQEAERAAMGAGSHDSGYVFTGIHGDPMAPDRLSRRFRQLSADACLPPVRHARPPARRGQPGPGRRSRTEDSPGPARAVQHRADRRHLHLSPARGRPEGSRGHRRPGHPGRLPRPRNQTTPPPIRPPATAPTRPSRDAGQRQPCPPRPADRISGPAHPPGPARQRSGKCPDLST
jgi:integrase